MGFFDDVQGFFGDVEHTAQGAERAISTIQGLTGTRAPGPAPAPATVQAVKQFPWVLIGLGIGAILIWKAMSK